MILYLDCSSGISGDMLVASLLSLAGATEKKPGVLDKVVRPALKAAGIDKRLVSIYRVERGGVEALTFRVPEGPGFATFDELIMSMYASKLDQEVADAVAALAQRMAAAEREVHGPGHDDLDELGGLDTAVDLISAVTLLHHLAPERVVASPPALGGGTVFTAHGELDVPAPAVRVLLRDVPTAPLDVTGRSGELTTPTGAALLAYFVHEFGPPPAGDVTATGVGAGTREVPDQPNVLRALAVVPAPEEETTMQRDDRDTKGSGGGAVRRTAGGIAGGVRRERPAGSPAEEPPKVGKTAAPETPPPAEPVPAAQAPAAAPAADAAPPAPEQPPASQPTPAPATGAPVETEESQTMPAEDQVTLDHVVLEANIDDMAPELLAHAGELLRQAGALDVWMTQALMKKGRPGVILHVLAAARDRRRLADIVFAETTTFGMRVVPVGRVYAEERRETVRLGGHEIHVRLSLVDGRPATVSPEYEDCRRAAEQLKRPAKVVYEAAQAAARARFSGA